MYYEAYADCDDDIEKQKWMAMIVKRKPESELVIAANVSNNSIEFGEGFATHRDVMLCYCSLFVMAKICGQVENKE